MTMKSAFVKFESLIKEIEQTIPEMDVYDLDHKPLEEKWSKKEILGHLIDSAINNLQRFTEAQFKPQPYVIKQYDQDELVKVNGYQKKDLNDIVDLCVSLNKQVLHVIIKLQFSLSNYSILLNNDRTETLKWLFMDYIEHMEHHMKQIRG